LWKEAESILSRLAFRWMFILQSKKGSPESACLHHVLHMDFYIISKVVETGSVT